MIRDTREPGCSFHPATYPESSRHQSASPSECDVGVQSAVARPPGRKSKFAVVEPEAEFAAMIPHVSETWNDIAYHWDAWGPPLRPVPEDLQIMQLALRQWASEVLAESAEVFLCGVTPEIVQMDWPLPVRLVGVDRSPSMVRVVWPGDIPGVRRGIVGDWLTPPVPPRSQDVVILDGGSNFFAFPTGCRSLLASFHTMLRPQGVLIHRLYAQADRKESLDEVLEAMQAGRIGNFHVFKWRVAGALQTSPEEGITLDAIWHACTKAGLDPARLPQPGWSPRAIESIRFYEGKQARHHFATLAEFQSLLAEHFERIEVIVPRYELGERCPILVARPRG